MERSDMIGWIFSSLAFEFRDVGRELGWHGRPTNIVADRVVDQLIEIGEAEACNVRQQWGGRSRSGGGSASSRASIRAGRTASVRPWTRHGGRGRTRRRKGT